MSKITLHVKDENLQILEIILQNLKEGLIEKIEIDKTFKKRQSSYQPPNKVVKEGERIQGKYIDASTYKKRLNKGK